MKKHNTRTLSTFKKSKQLRSLSMLTCYDYQSACLMNETDLDIILVGDSLGNVVLGLDTTIGVTIDHMEIFSQAVKRGAVNKFVVVDVPFGVTHSFDKAIEQCSELFKNDLASVPQSLRQF